MSHFEALILKSRYGNVDGFSLVGQSIKEVFTNGTVETLLSTGIFNVGLAIDKDNNLYFTSCWSDSIQELPVGCRSMSCVVSLPTLNVCVVSMVRATQFEPSSSG